MMCMQAHAVLTWLVMDDIPGNDASNNGIDSCLKAPPNLPVKPYSSASLF